jgi:hypothetical protein
MTAAAGVVNGFAWVVICSAWGQGTDWMRNIRARPGLRIQIG